MSSFHPVNPKPFLKTLINKEVIVRLKWNKTEYKGRLISFDNYMNFQLADTTEIVRGESKGVIGEVFIRCNNVLFVRENTEMPGEDTSKKETEEEEEGQGIEDAVMEEK